MLRVPVEAEKTIDVSLGVTDYSLVSYFTNRKIYGSIVKFIRPSTWNYEIKFVYPNDWDLILNGGEFDDYTNPVRATIFANTLKLYPAPTANATLTLYVRLKMPSTDATDSIDPETPEDFDSALENWILWKLLGDVNYFNSFLEQITVIGNTLGYKGYTIQKSRVIW
jgi:hypothetical protein